MHLLSHRLFKVSTWNVYHFLQGLRQLRYNHILVLMLKVKLNQLRHGSFMLVTRMTITMVYFYGAAHHKRNNNYSMGITALSRCEYFFPLFFSFPLIQPCGLCMLFFLLKSFLEDVLSFVIPIFKFVDDEAISKISETLDANYLRVSSIISWSNCCYHWHCWNL